ncbi:MAG TPA: hypothetical protein VKK61_05295, partial [Tepidisphaeraceae bacterium]|nr:hypothetical protein [Tepidisphaeraceae bacterium]
QRFDDIDAFHRYLIESKYHVRYTKGALQWNSSDDPENYFLDASGMAMKRDRLYLSPRGGAPLPDIVCEPIEGLKFHTIFHDAPLHPDHETIIEVK